MKASVRGIAREQSQSPSGGYIDLFISYVYCNGTLRVKVNTKSFSALFLEPICTVVILLYITLTWVFKSFLFFPHHRAGAPDDISSCFPLELCDTWVFLPHPNNWSSNPVCSSYCPYTFFHFPSFCIHDPPFNYTMNSSEQTYWVKQRKPKQNKKADTYH